jgi:hypothetical protein
MHADSIDWQGRSHSLCLTLLRFVVNYRMAREI